MDAFTQQDLPVAEAEGAHAERRAAWVAGLPRMEPQRRLEALCEAADDGRGDAYSAGLLMTVFLATDWGVGSPAPRSLGQLARAVWMRCSDRQVQRARRLAGRLLSVKRRGGLQRPAAWSIDWHAVW